MDPSAPVVELLSEPHYAVITGMNAEATVIRHGLRKSKVAATVVAGGGRRAVQALTEIIPGCTCILSCGIAGGLDPALAAGAVIVADTVIDGGTRHECRDDVARIARSLQQQDIDARVAPIAGSDMALGTADQKLAVHARTGAAAVDMESHAAARIAAQNGIPFLAIRVIADPAGRQLPDMAHHAMGPGLRSLRGIGQSLKSVLGNPRELRDIGAVAVDAGKAMLALRRVVSHLGVLRFPA